MIISYRTKANQQRHQTRPDSVFSQLIKNSLAKNHIKLQYGPVTTAESITHLEPYKIDFLKQTKFLAELHKIYPKISVNLNETSKRVYIFGAAGQVSECKQAINKELARLSNKEFRLENREVATYLVEKEIKEHILKHVYTYFNKKTKSSNYGHINPDLVSITLDDLETLKLIYRNTL